jgi:type II secretory pathway pseudopilin PulG
MTAAAILAALAVLAALIVVAARGVARTRRELEHERSRAEVLDERRAMHNLYPHERRLEVASQRPPEQP